MIGRIIRDNDRRLQVPVDVAVKEPGPRVVRKEPNRNFVFIISHTHDIPDNRIDEVVG